MTAQSELEAIVARSNLANDNLEQLLTSGLDNSQAKYFYEVLNYKDNLIGDAFTEYLIDSDNIPSLTNAYERLKQNNIKKKR